MCVERNNFKTKLTDILINYSIFNSFKYENKMKPINKIIEIY